MEKVQRNIIWKSEKFDLYSYHQLTDISQSIDIYVSYGEVEYVGTLYTPAIICTYLESNQDDMYFFDSSSIVLKDLCLQTVCSAVDQLISSGEIDKAFELSC